MLVMAVCAVTLIAGFLLKGQCLAGFDGRQYSRLCYNDIQPLYGVRGISENKFPYVDGRLADGQLLDGAIEYPVLTGLFMWGTGELADDDRQYLRVSALLLAPFGLFTAYLLVKMAGTRALMWAAAPALVLYAFHNWDLLVVAAAVFGFYAWHRGWPVWAGAAFGVGAAFKLYPIIFLAPLLLDRLYARDRDGAWGSLAAGIGTAVAINLPFMVASRSGWWVTYDFHRLRGPNYDAIWTWLPFGWTTPAPDRLNLITGALTAATIAGALAVGWLRATKEGRYPFLQVSAALLVAWLLWTKVHSPQYALWLLPFFVLVEISWVWWVAYSIVDLMVYVGVFRYFYDFGYRGLTGETFARNLMIAGVWARAALLAVLVVVFLRARRGHGGELAGVFASHPPPTLTDEDSRALVPG